MLTEMLLVETRLMRLLLVRTTLAAGFQTMYFMPWQKICLYHAHVQTLLETGIKASKLSMQKKLHSNIMLGRWHGYYWALLVKSMLKIKNKEPSKMI